MQELELGTVSVWLSPVNCCCGPSPAQLPCQCLINRHYHLHYEMNQGLERFDKNARLHSQELRLLITWRLLLCSPIYVAVSQNPMILCPRHSMRSQPLLPLSCHPDCLLGGKTLKGNTGGVSFPPGNILPL